MSISLYNFTNERNCNNGFQSIYHFFTFISFYYRLQLTSRNHALFCLNSGFVDAFPNNKTTKNPPDLCDSNQPQNKINVFDF